MIEKGANITSALVLQPGWTLETDRYGVISGAARYQGDESAMHLLWPPFGASHPRHASCKLVKAVCTGIRAGIVEFACEYLGVSGTASDAEVEHMGSLSQDPIVTHADFAEFGTEANGAVFNAETGEFEYFKKDALHDLGGVDSYLLPGSVVRVTTHTTDDDDDLEDLGAIADHPALPALGGDRDWLMTGWARTDYGHLYRVTREYTASGPKGWNPVIYGGGE